MSELTLFEALHKGGVAARIIGRTDSDAEYTAASDIICTVIAICQMNHVDTVDRLRELLNSRP